MDNLIKGNRKARRLALQALYQWLMTQQDVKEIELQFHTENDMSKVNRSHFHFLLAGVIQNLTMIEEHLIPFLDRMIPELNPIELTILRLAAFELLNCNDLPYRVVLDEAISLAKEFGSQDGYKYVNGVLNNLAKLVRQHEC